MNEGITRHIFCLFADTPIHCRPHLLCLEAPWPPGGKECLPLGWLRCFLWVCLLPGIESSSCCRDRLVPLAIKIVTMPGCQAIVPEYPEADRVAGVRPSRAGYWLGRVWCLVRRELEAHGPASGWVAGSWDLGSEAKIDLIAVQPWMDGLPSLNLSFLLSFGVRSLNGDSCSPPAVGLAFLLQALCLCNGFLLPLR